MKKILESMAFEGLNYVLDTFAVNNANKCQT